MQFNIGKKFKYYFPSSFEMFVIGTTFLLLSFPGIGMIFVRHDDIFPNMFSNLRQIGIAWGCVTGMIGLSLIFCGVRRASSPGTMTYRLTHPWGA